MKQSIWFLHLFISIYHLHFSMVTNEVGLVKNVELFTYQQYLHHNWILTRAIYL